MFMYVIPSSVIRKAFDPFSGDYSVDLGAKFLVFVVLGIYILSIKS